MKFTKQKPDPEPGFQMTPMIDVVFQMLVYFLAATTIVAMESQLSANLPGQKAISEESKKQVEDVTITVLSDGNILADGTPYDSKDSETLPELTAMLKDLAAVFENQAVIIKGDSRAKHKRIISVLNACSSAGIKNLAFSAD